VTPLLIRSGVAAAFVAVAALACPLPSVSRPASRTVVILLKYADVSEVAGVLVSGANVASNDTFVPQQSNIGASSLAGSFGGGGAEATGVGGFNAAGQQQNFGGAAVGQQQQGLAQRISDNVAIDRRLNAIILTGTADVVAALRATIDKLDVPVPSVLLEAQIVELTDTAARNIGLDLSPSGNGIVINGTSGSTDTSTGNTTGSGFTSKTGAFPAGQLSFAANLYAQISEGNGRVIARPRILAQSGQPASILTGDALPILTNVLIAGNTGAAAQQVNYINVGVNLQIQPRVSSDGYVTSHIYSEVSSVTGYVSGNIPQISQRTASTIATVRDGQSIVIGGLRQDNEIRNRSRLPLVSDIPLIGSLFKHVSTTRTRDNLYIIITPHIVPLRGTTAPMPARLPMPVGMPLIGPTPPPQVTPPSPPRTHALVTAKTRSFPVAQTNLLAVAQTNLLTVAQTHPLTATSMRGSKRVPYGTHTIDAAPDPRHFPAFAYEGHWQHRRGSDHNTVESNSASLQPGSRVTLAFLGTQVRLFGIVGPTGGRAALTLDGIPQKVDAGFYAPLLRARALVYRSPRLRWGPHWVTVTVMPPSSSQSKERYVNIAGAEYDS